MVGLHYAHFEITYRLRPTPWWSNTMIHAGDIIKIIFFSFVFENLAYMQCILGSSWYTIKVASCNTWIIQMTSLIKWCGDTYNLHQSISPFAYFLGICSNSKGMVILVGVTFLSFAYIGLYFLVKWSPKTSTSYLPK